MIIINDKYSFFLQGTNNKGVLLIHGLTGVPAEMKLVARELNRAGYSVYAPILAGHGVDKATLIQTCWQDWLESVEKAAIAFSEQVSEIYTAGICVGGKLGMLLAHKAPKIIKASTIYSPCFRYDGWNVPFYYPILSKNIGWLSKIPLLDRLSFQETSAIGIKDERLRGIMENMTAEGVIEDFPAKGLVEMYKLGKELKKNLPDIKTPTLILHAREDDLSHPRNAQIIADNIGGSHSLQMVDDCYHMIHVDAQHKKVAALTAQFFAGQYA